MSALSGLFRFGKLTNRATSVIDREIDLELDFHIECATQDLIASGMNPKQAADEANRRFGARDSIRRQCQKIDYGNHLWLIFGLCGSLLVSVGVICWLSTLLHTFHQRNQQIENQLSALLLVDEPKNDLVGEVKDSKDAPVVGTKILLIFKSWPNGRYQQESFASKTENDGTFRFPKLYSSKTQTAFLVSVLGEGHTMQSEYVLYQANEHVKPFQFRLKQALKKTFILHRSDGKPLANAQVFPASRKSQNGNEEFLIYDQSGGDADYRTDAKGKVRMSLFETGDTVEMGVIDGESFSLVVDQSVEQIVSAKKKNDQPQLPVQWAPQPESVDRSKVESVRKIAIPFRLTDEDNDDLAIYSH